MSEFEIEETHAEAPERIVLYGTPGIGKTTFIADMPNMLLLDLERGSLKIPYVRRNKKPLTTFVEFEGALEFLRNGKHSFTSFGIDTIDALESMIQQHLCARDGVDSIELAAKGFGRGPTAAMEKMRVVLSKIDDIVSSRNMHFVGVAHHRLEMVKNPSGYDYQRHSLKLHDKVTPIVMAYPDHVLFASRKMIVSETMFDQNRARAIKSGDRVLRTEEGPTHVAKTRARLPDPIPLSWHDFVCHLGSAGWPRLLRETVIDNARRLGDTSKIEAVRALIEDRPDVPRLAAANARLVSMLLPEPVEATDSKENTSSDSSSAKNS